MPWDRNLISQEHGYLFSPFKREARSSDATVFGVARAEMRASARVRVAVTAGGGIVRESAPSRVSLYDVRSRTYGPFSAETESISYTFGATGGADLIVVAARHLSIVPQIRMVAIRRGPPSESETFFGTLGLATVQYRIGLGLRASL